MKKHLSVLLVLLMTLALLLPGCTKTPPEPPKVVTPAAWMTMDRSWIPGQNYDGIQIMEIRRENESYLEIAHVPVTGIAALDETLANDARARMDAFEADSCTVEGDKLFMLECTVTRSDTGIMSILFSQQDTLNLAANGAEKVAVYNFDPTTAAAADPLARFALTDEEKTALVPTLTQAVANDPNNALTGLETWLTDALAAGGSGWNVSIAQYNGAALLVRTDTGSMMAVPISDAQVEAARESLKVPEPPVIPEGGKLVALTFDDGPSSANTAHLLDYLKQYNVKATFFLQGKYVKNNPDLVAREYQEGHEIGNHTYDHPKLTDLSFDEVDDQVKKCNDAIEAACGFRPTLLRPPYGSTTYSLRDHMRDVLDMACIKWAGDLRDSFTSDINEIVNEALTTTKDGDILLLHDTHDYSVEAVPRIIEGLQAQGFTFVTVSQIITRNGDPIVAGESYRYVRPAN